MQGFPLLRQYLLHGDLKWCNYMGCSESWSLKCAFGNHSVGKAMSGICPNFPSCSPSFTRGWGSEDKQPVWLLGISGVINDRLRQNMCCLANI